MNTPHTLAPGISPFHWRPVARAALLFGLFGTLGSSALAQITFYESEGFRGRAFTVNRAVADFTRQGFNDRASSAVVQSGRWEVCENSRYGGACVTLREGSYSNLGGMGLNDALSSVRPASARRRAEGMAPDAPPPQAQPDYAWRRRAGEAVYTVPVRTVHEVMGAPQERCWIERQDRSERASVDPGRALLGAVLGGVIGHQIGGGTGRDIATVGGAVAGAVIGGKSGNDNGDRGDLRSQDLRRCEQVHAGPPAYWDVGYTFRGVQHHVQMDQPPGPTLLVNAAGEPRQ